LSYLQIHIRVGTVSMYVTQTYNMSCDVFMQWYCCGIDESGWAVYRGSEWFDEQPGMIG